jgi:hypothetical protein
MQSSAYRELYGLRRIEQRVLWLRAPDGKVLWSGRAAPPRTSGLEHPSASFATYRSPAVPFVGMSDGIVRCDAPGCRLEQRVRPLEND